MGSSMRRYSSSSAPATTTTPATAPSRMAAGGADPVAGAGDGDQPGQEAVDREADVPDLAHAVGDCHGHQARGAGCQRGVRGHAADAFEIHGGKRAAGIEAVPAEPRSRPPEAAMVRSCGSMGPPPSRLNLRPRRGPRTIAPASATKPPMVCTTVEPAKSWKPVPSDGRKLPALPMVARKPSGPQAQWPMIG